MDIIYLINTEKGPYIGKLSKETFLEDHLRRSGMFTTNSPVDAWEAAWATDLRQNGLSNSSFIQGTKYWDEETVRTKLAQSFDIIISRQNYQDITSGTQMLDLIGKMWARSDTLSVTEALCILLAAKNPNILNLKIDFLSHKAGLNAEELFTKEEVARVQSEVRKKWMPSIWIGLTDTNSTIEEANEDIKKDIEALGYKPVNVLKHPKVVKWLKDQSVEPMKEHVIKDLKNYKKRLKEKRNVQNKAIFDYINEVIKTVKESSVTNRSEIIDLVDDMFSNGKWQKKVARNYDFSKVNNNIDAILDLLNNWYKNTSIDTILGSLNITNPLNENFIKHYKNQFTNFISNLLDDAIPYQLSYSDKGGWLEQKIKTDGKQLGLSKYYEWYINAKDSKNYTPSEKPSSLMEDIRPVDKNFIHNHWAQIYAEQIVLWLKEKHPESFLLQRRDLVDGYKRDINSSNEIEYY